MTWFTKFTYWLIPLLQQGPTQSHKSAGIGQTTSFFGALKPLFTGFTAPALQGLKPKYDVFLTLEGIAPYYICSLTQKTPSPLLTEGKV